MVVKKPCFLIDVLPYCHILEPDHRPACDGERQALCEPAKHHSVSGEKNMATFLKPELEYGTFCIGETTEGRVILPYDIFETERKHYKLRQSQRWRRRTGWYGRLSAPGYLDGTDWSGPFESEAEANECLSDMYDGDPIEDDFE
jgi:hypothetical protein